MDIMRARRQAGERRPEAAGGWVQPNPLGYVFVIGQAAFVAVMAELELIGLRKSAVAVPARS